MTFPIYYLLIPYGLFVLLGIIFVVANVLHMMAFGLQGIKTGFWVLVYIGTTTWVLKISYDFIMMYNWSEEFSLEDLMGSITQILI